MRSAPLVIALALALGLPTGCGRLGFDDLTAGTGDGGLDAPLPVGRWQAVATGFATTCAITLDGELWCFGQGFGGQLGIGASPTASLPARVGTASDWTSVATMKGHTCATRTDLSLWCWGNNAAGALGTGVLDQTYDEPEQVAGLRWRRVTAGEESSCALADDGVLWCWGRNASGQLGLGTIDDEPRPREVGTATWTTITQGLHTTCGIQVDGTLWCWGSNGLGQVGDGTTINRTQPVPISAAKQWLDVTSGYEHTCAIELDGTPWCWGRNFEGQLGDGTQSPRPTPTPVPVPALARIVAGLYHTCGVTTAGAMWCWGAGMQGRIAGLDQLAVRLPIEVAAPRASTLAAGDAMTCLIDPEARLFCTGGNASGQAGQAPFGDTHQLARADQRTDWTQVFAHAGHACGTLTDTSTWCWGRGVYGQLGDNGQVDRQVPVAASTLGLEALALSKSTTVGVAAAQAVYLTGYDRASASYHGMFTEVAAGSSVAVGDDHLCTVLAGVLRCAGANNQGQLGDGTTSDRPAGITVPGTWSAVYAGGNATCATVAGSNALRCWGAGLPTGTNTTADVPSPAAPVLAAPVSSVAFAHLAACALVGTGELWCWGSNYFGQLGIGSAIDLLQPVRVGTRTDWIDVDLGDLHGCAIAADGTLWCWGHEDQGQLGTGTLTPSATPIQVGTDTTWQDVACGDHFTCAVRADGSRWCSGANANGELGNGRAWLPAFTVVP